MIKFDIRPEAAPLFLQLLRSLDDNAPCVVDPAPFSSEDRHERAEAAEACQWCPALEPCAAYADAQREPFHVWAGVDRSPKPRTKKKEQAALTEFQDMTVVTLRCATEDCPRWATAYGRHLENLLAAGPWHCPDHAEPREAPC